MHHIRLQNIFGLHTYIFFCTLALRTCLGFNPRWISIIISSRFRQTAVFLLPDFESAGATGSSNFDNILLGKCIVSHFMSLIHYEGTLMSLITKPFRLITVCNFTSRQMRTILERSQQRHCDAKFMGLAHQRRSHNFCDHFVPIP